MTPPVVNIEGVVGFIVNELLPFLISFKGRQDDNTS
jgi:hypothetical protein